MSDQTRAYQPTSTHYEEQWSGGTVHGSNLLVCPDCGAVVARESTDLHDKWHRGEFGA